MNFSSEEWSNYFDLWLKEDVGSGDHSSLASIPRGTNGSSQLILKEDGVIAGLELAQALFAHVDEQVIFTPKMKDGEFLKKGTILATAEGPVHSLLVVERLMLNLMQRLSGVATQTHDLVQMVGHTGVTLLDTRKTTPGLRLLEKWAVTMGGGANHRIGLFDMIMLKDNHVDSAGGITTAVNNTREYLRKNNLDLEIEVETRSLDEVREAIDNKVDRIMFDNFSPDTCKEAVVIVSGRAETEASGGITVDTLKDYAETGVNYISIGALTHSVKALDISFKTKFKA
ncbi:carboxylating nicotinate-nucleotide diphosphorylase [Bacteroidia bacterium]|jgi:nicotinate-nucleotide pyrophosphorylase (carboxylating)|nr:carboxylating nicotinate-nucleotide diphosphorylase [Bacteroidia bacterium]MDA8628732.1 carboxylating nicotinate-nucleotide diphosphorylase [Bacteroidia bacterium]MDA9213931.1 carboxylating nicotinate-nucleotide diphosphorylase [Bacteroidia bacterium]